MEAITDELDPEVAPSLPGLEAPRHRLRSARMVGEITVAMGFATEEAVEHAVANARETGRLTGRVLIDEGVLTSQQLARVLADRFGVERVDLAVFAVDPNALRLVDGAFVRRYDAVPIGFDGDELLLAMADPTNLLAIDDITMLTGRQVRPVVAAYDDIQRVTAQRLGAADFPEFDEPDTVESNDIDISSPDFDVNSIDSSAPDDGPVIKLVNSVLTRAIRRGASDIHFDPGSDEMRVQYRVDGMLDSALHIPRRMAAGVVSRLKIMANLDIAERRRPQDGRTALLIDEHEIDLRVVTLPTVYGEAVVTRILDSSVAPGGLTDVGLLDADREKLEASLARPYGGVLVCGPTGSGKSTSLYAALGHINTGEKTIVTIEDPVEYRLDGIKQMHVNVKAGVTFATGLRAIMRADPDIIMVGEIRDQETAKIAVEAALTGHLILSTLHTRDAPNAVGRLLEMGIEPFLLSSAIDCVVAQRLARRLCDECKTSEIVPADVMRGNGFDVDEDVEVFQPVGCSRCSDSGYRGRVGIFEVLVLDSDIRAMVLARDSADAIAEAAVAKGMTRLREDGLEKIRLGITSPAEVLRVTSIA